MTATILLVCRLAAAWLSPPVGFVQSAATAERTMVVEVASGRVFRGELDRRTDADRLWLRWDHGGSSVLRPIERDRVVRVRLAGDSYSAEEFFTAAAVTLQSRPGSHVTAPMGVKMSTLGRKNAIRPDTPRGTGGKLPAIAAESTSCEEPGQVRSLAIRAWPANWDADVEMDGLVVEVSPVGAEGELVPADGTVQFSLIGVRAGWLETRRSIEPLGRWVERIRREDFGLLGVRVRLPFQAAHPEFDLEWQAQASLHARLSVSGQGVFEASESPTRIRPSSAFRDRYWQMTGRWFLPGERTGRGG